MARKHCRLYLWVLLSVVLAHGWTFGQQLDLVIRGARVIDGTGNPWRYADVGVKDGRIVRVGSIEKDATSPELDASGLYLSPGFIDMHNHSDQGLEDPERRLNETFVTQGVTTMMVGIDGNGPWDIETRASIWRRQGIGVNVGSYVGHNAIRLQVMGIDKRDPTPAELEQMKQLVAKGMTNGAFGLSTGLEYIPGIYSTTSEVIELAKVAAQHKGIYDSHYRDEFAGFLDSVREGIRISREAGILVNFGHFKVIGQHNWGRMPDAVRLIEEARKSGLQITADQYPWTNGATSQLTGLFQVPPGLGRISELYEILQVQHPSGTTRPEPSTRRKMEQEYLGLLQAALQNPASREQIRTATEDGIDKAGHRNWIHMWGYDWIRIVRSSRHPEYMDQVLTQIMPRKSVSGFDLMADLTVEEGDELGISIGPLSEDDVVYAMKQPWVMISSDGSLPRFGEGFPHPRSYASFPRSLGHYVREEGVLTLEDAVRKMTSLPAQTLGLEDRGVLRPGAWADITIFDAELIRGKATYEQPHQYSQGVVHVIVNGKFVLKSGSMTGEAPGVILYGPEKPKPATLDSARPD